MSHARILDRSIPSGVTSALGITGPNRAPEFTHLDGSKYTMSKQNTLCRQRITLRNV